MINKFKNYFFLLILFLSILFFYSPFLIGFKLPIPADTIVGIYNPYRDFYSAQFPRGIPFKNFLITDPVRQTYVWKELAMSELKKGDIPLWNPYEMSGKPLLANFQSSVFYPLNIILLFSPFFASWSIFIMLQSFLAGLFMFLFLANLRLDKRAAFMGSLAFCFSGFSIAWLEWGTILQTGLWLPLLLLSIDQVLGSKKRKLVWFVIYIFSLTFSFFAGNLQIFVYLYILSIFYFLLRWFEYRKNLKNLILFIISNLIFVILTFVQWLPTLEFLNLSLRESDRNYKIVEGWFIPYKQLIQFVAPDFFGNPATLNYWGTWNYGELVGFIGILPLILAFFAFCKRNLTVWFFAIVAIVGLVFSLPNYISVIPFKFDLPFVSSAQPTRLLFVIVFSLCVLCAFGMDYLAKNSKIKVRDLWPLLLFGLIFILLWVGVFEKSSILFLKTQDVYIAKRNLILPTLVFLISCFYIFLLFAVKNHKARNFVFILMLLLVIFDLTRFAQKFTPFVSREYLFPTTKSLAYLKSQKGIFRIGVLDQRIMAPNFFTHYKLQTIEGYDPLYLRNYAEFIKAMEQNSPNIKEPFGFNRIITPHNYNSQLFDFLDTEFVLSLDDVNSPKLEKVFEEGQTKVYKNKNAFPRTFFVKNVVDAKNDIKALFQYDLSKTAILSDESVKSISNLSIGKTEIAKYSDNLVIIKTSNKGKGFLVFSDVYYPTWVAAIDGKDTKIYQTNHAFRGVFVPYGSHTIVFRDKLF